MLGLLHAQVTQVDREHAIEVNLRRRRLLDQLARTNGSADLTAPEATRSNAVTHRATMRPAGASIRNATR